MNPRRAAWTIAEQLLGRAPDVHELRWVEMVVRSVLPQNEDHTPVTLRGFPPPLPKGTR